MIEKLEILVYFLKLEFFIQKRKSKWVSSFTNRYIQWKVALLINFLLHSPIGCPSLSIMVISCSQNYHMLEKYFFFINVRFCLPSQLQICLTATSETNNSKLRFTNFTRENPYITSKKSILSSNYLADGPHTPQLTAVYQTAHTANTCSQAITPALC